MQNYCKKDRRMTIVPKSPKSQMKSKAFDVKFQNQVSISSVATAALVVLLSTAREQHLPDLDQTSKYRKSS